MRKNLFNVLAVFAVTVLLSSCELQPNINFESNQQSESEVLSNSPVDSNIESEISSDLNSSEEESLPSQEPSSEPTVEPSSEESSELEPSVIDPTDDSSSEPEPEVEVKGIVIASQDNVRTLIEEQTLQLTATVYPLEASQLVTWTSTDANIATVNEEGLVTAVAAGNVSIEAYSVANPEVSASYALIIEEKEPEVILPTSVEIFNSAESTTFKVGETLSLSAVVYPDGANQRVNWTSSDETIASVSRGTVTALKEGNVTITVTSDEVETVLDTIDLTIEPSDDPVVNQDWPNIEYTTHETYMECENETLIKVKGVVTHVSPVKENTVSYYVQNGEDGYYVYAQNSLAFPVELGKTYEIGGYKKYYRGLNEIVDVEYFVESNEAAEYVVRSINDANPSSLEAMNEYHCSFVSGDATIKSAVNPAEKAYSVNVTINGYDTVLRVDPSYMSAEEFASISSKFKTAIAGSKVSFEGIMTAFGYGTPSPQIQVVSAEDLVFAELTDADLLNAVAPTLTIDSSIGTDEATITLPTTLEGYPEILVSWASDNELINVKTGAVTHAAEDTTVTLTATITLNAETTTRTFNVTVFGTAATSYETVASLDLEDALAPNQWGNSESKGSYAAATVELGTPVSTWLLDNALIASATNDRYDGTLGIRAKAGGRIEIQEDGEYNYVQFDAAVYGNDAKGIKVGVEYSLDSGSTWVDSGTIISIDTTTLETYRISLPEGVKRVAIYIVKDSGNRVNIDNILLMK